MCVCSVEVLTEKVEGRMEVILNTASLYYVAKSMWTSNHDTQYATAEHGDKGVQAFHGGKAQGSVQATSLE